MNPTAQARGLSLPLREHLLILGALPGETRGCMTGQPWGEDGKHFTREPTTYFPQPPMLDGVGNVQTVAPALPRECLSTQAVYHKQGRAALTPCLKAGASAPHKVSEGCEERRAWAAGRRGAGGAA